MEDDKPKIVQQSFKTFGNSQAPNSVKVSEGIDIKSEKELTIKDSSGNVGKVLLPPFPPARRGTYTDKEYDKLQQQQNAEMLDFWSKKKSGNAFRIEQSRLYQTK